jgi:hypothetical protein
MTAQISDVVIYNGVDHSITGLAGEGLFDPFQVGWRPVAMSTACWRGFHCSYHVADERLLLDRVTIGLEHKPDEPPPLLFDHVPTKNLGHGRFEFRDMAHPLDFNGGLLLGAGFLQQYYVHMGFHPAYKYRKVFELIFERGRLVETTDRSQLMAELRNSVSRHRMMPDPQQSMAEVEKWIEQCFSLDYRL